MAMIPILKMILVTSCSALLYGQAAGEWKPVLEEGGVRAYARQLPGTGLLEFRSTAVIPAPIEVVGTVLRDVEGLKRSSKNCLEARILQYKSSNDYSFYVAYGMPIPFAHRDVIIHATTRYDLKKGRAICELQAQPDALPPKAGYVRIRDFRAQFVIEYLARDKTGIVYTSRVDPGGNIPDFLINYTSKHAVTSSVVDLRSATQNPRHIQAAHASSDHALVEEITHNPATLKAIVKERLGEYIPERDLVQMLVDDPGVYFGLVSGQGSFGEILLHGFGSRESQVRAISDLLRQWLMPRLRDAARVERLATDRSLVERILRGQGGAAAVRALAGGKG